MSVVVAYKDIDRDRVIVGCDSQVTRGGYKSTLQNKNNWKIFKPMDNENLIIGVVGDLRDINLLSLEKNLIDELTIIKGEVDFKYIVKTIVPKIFKILIDNKRIKIKDGVVDDMCSSVLFVYKNKIYGIYSDGAVIEYEDFCALGSGEQLAYGSLNSYNGSDAQDAVVDAIKSSIKNDLYVKYPIILMNTLDDKVIIVEK